MSNDKARLDYLEQLYQGYIKAYPVQATVNEKLNPNKPLRRRFTICLDGNCENIREAIDLGITNERNK
jgi:hypothetical protein